MEHIHEGIVVTDASSRVLWANRAYCTMTGHPLESLIGRTPAILRPPDVTVTRSREIWDSLGALGRFQGRVENVRADGSRYQASISVVHVQPRTAGSGFYVCTMKDVSADVELERQLGRMAEQAVRARDTTILALASLAEQRDPDAGAHLARIEAYTTAMAEWLLQNHPDALPAGSRDAVTIGRCAMLHDIGKVGVPDAILLKPGKLDSAEQRVMREHPRLGAEILDRVIQHQPESSFLRIARDVVAYHHEAYDGTGYPYGVRGEEIPLVAQLISVADVLDALTSRRPYKPAYPLESAVAWIVERRGAQFGPLAVDALLACKSAIGAVHAALGDEAGDVEIAPSGIDRTSLSAGLPPSRPGIPRERVRPGLLEVLAEAIGNDGGEVVVRSGAESGRIHLWQGGIAWAEVTTERGALAERLIAEHGVDEAQIRKLVEHCKGTDQSFIDHLVAEGLMSREGLREVLREHVASRIAAILALPDPVALFVPDARPRQGAQTFTLDELLPKREAPGWQRR